MKDQVNVENVNAVDENSSQPTKKRGLFNRIKYLNFGYLNKGSIQSKIGISFGINVGVLLGVGILAILTIYNASSKFSYSAEHDAKVIDNSRRLESLISEMESNQRGYIITGENSYLNTYSKCVKDFGFIIQKQRILAIDNPEQIERLYQIESTVDDWLDQSAQTEISIAQNVHESGIYSDELKKVVSSGTGKRLIESLKEQFAGFNESHLKSSTEQYESTSFMSNLGMIVLAVILILASTTALIIGKRLSNSIALPIEQVKEYALSIARGEMDLDSRLNLKLDTDEALSDEIIELANSMIIMRNNILDKDQKNYDQKWLLEGATIIANEVKGERGLTGLANGLINSITPFLDGQMGTFYILNESGDLKRMASYAYDKRNQSVNSVKIGEGLVGQAALEKKCIIFNQIPDNYFNIGSGLGQIMPKSIIVVPVLFQGEVKGVIEICTASQFSDLQLKFVESAQESIGIALNSAESRLELSSLLSSSQQMTDKLKSSEEELKTQQEELSQANFELQEKAQQLEENNLSILEKNEALDQARESIKLKAEALEVSSKYKSEFLANMSHELRTPLNSVLVLAQLLRDNPTGNLNEEQLEFAEIINKSGVDLLKLINEVLDLAKVESGKLEIDFKDLNIKDMTKDMSDMFLTLSKEKEVNFEINVDPNLPDCLSSDEDRLKQIVKNLLSNAFKFTEKEGQVTLDVNLIDPKITFEKPELVNSRKVIEIAVTDTGIGIPSDKLATVFEAFQQADGSTARKYGGTGLGLSISREIAGLLGGEMELKSEVGQGSRFSVYLPITNSKASTKKEAPKVEVQTHDEPVTSEDDLFGKSGAKYDSVIPDDRENIESGDKVMLIVEDDLSFARVLLDFTRRKGYKGIVTDQGDLALKHVKAYEPQAIILDMGLPVMDGWEVLKKIKESRFSNIPVHVISGADRQELGLGMGAVSYLTKPVSTEQLASVFDNLSMSENGKGQVLIVEDNKEQSKAVQAIFKRNEIETMTAFTAKEAVEMIEENEYQCITLDLSLSDSEGLTLFKKIKKTTPKTPIIVFTGKDLSKSEVNAIEQFEDTSIVLKTENSLQRILEEAELFLSHINSKNGSSKNGSPKNGKAKLNGLPNSIKGKKILIVDDDVRNIYTLKAILKPQELEIVTATNGLEGVEAMKNDPSIDLVLMDIMMPEMDGYEAMTKLREDDRFTDLPIIALTAKAMKGDREKCLNSGASDYISKPVNIEQLLSLMRVWLYA